MGLLHSVDETFGFGYLNLCFLCSRQNWYSYASSIQWFLPYLLLWIDILLVDVPITAGFDSEMGSCCNSVWSSFPSLLGQKEDLVIPPLVMQCLKLVAPTFGFLSTATSCSCGTPFQAQKTSDWDALFIQNSSNHVPR